MNWEQVLKVSLKDISERLSSYFIQKDKTEIFHISKFSAQSKKKQKQIEI